MQIACGRNANRRWAWCKLGDDAIEEFLSDLVTSRRVSPNTQIRPWPHFYSYIKRVLGREQEQLTFTHARRTRRLPVVLNREDVRAILDALHGKYRLMGYFLYGSGLRQKECLALRVKDVDPDYGQVIVRDGKGSKDRVTMFPTSANRLFEKQFLQARAVLDSEIMLGLPGVSLPAALARKFPNARFEWAWQYVFLSSRYSKEPRTGRTFGMSKRFSERTTRSARWPFSSRPTSESSLDLEQ